MLPAIPPMHAAPELPAMVWLPECLPVVDHAMLVMMLGFACAVAAGASGSQTPLALAHASWRSCAPVFPRCVLQYSTWGLTAGLCHAQPA